MLILPLPMPCTHHQHLRCHKSPISLPFLRSLRLIPLLPLPQLFPRGQNIWPKAERQQLAHRPHNPLALLIKHENWSFKLQELAEELATHAARGAKIQNVGCDADGFEGADAVACYHGCAHGDALGAGADGVGCVFYVCTGDDVRCGWGGGIRGVEEERGADAEEGVRACIFLLFVGVLFFIFVSIPYIYTRKLAFFMA